MRKDTQKEKRIITKRSVFGGLAVLWMVVIFGFSARNGITSTGDSHYIGMLVGKTFVPGFIEWNSTRQIAFAQMVDFPIRKTAHAMEYAVLAVFFYRALTDKTKKISKRKCLAAWGISTLYAATDEIHQLYVPGRSGRLTDVILDSTGAAAGVLLCVMGYYFLKFMRKNILQRNSRNITNI